MKKALLFILVFLAVDCFGQDSVDKRIKTYFNENKKIKAFVIKVKQPDSKQYFHFNKKNRQFIGYQKYDKLNGGLTKYLFKDGQLIFIIYQPKKDFDRQRKGGLYYFVDGSLKEKEEYNIVRQDPNELLAEAKQIEIKAKDLIKVEN